MSFCQRGSSAACGKGGPHVADCVEKRAGVAILAWLVKAGLTSVTNSVWVVRTSIDVCSVEPCVQRGLFHPPAAGMLRGDPQDWRAFPELHRAASLQPLAPSLPSLVSGSQQPRCSVEPEAPSPRVPAQPLPSCVQPLAPSLPSLVSVARQTRVSVEPLAT